ncbi:MAG: leucine-rich repeat protein [Bacteroidaceae bacterium]|nr:leucine-rich repeat protein [Bacteroidaceae bacterium]
MKHKSLFLACVLTAIGLFVPTTCLAEEYYIEDANGNTIKYVYWTDEEGVWVAGLNGIGKDESLAGHVIIPATISISSSGEVITPKKVRRKSDKDNPILTQGDGTEMPVIGVQWNAFSGNTNLKSIDLPETVNYIGGYAFQNCTSLSEVTIRSTGDLFVMESAFTGCTSLTSLSLFTPWAPRIGNNLFSGCDALADSGTLHVPAGSASTYSSDEWTAFPTIADDLPVAPDNVSDFRINDMTFHILTQNDKEGYTVQVGSGNGPAISMQTEGAVTIPATVAYNGVTYTVTHIASYAFEECYGMTDLYCESTTPPSLASWAFPDEISNYCAIHVDDISAYANSEWGQYFNFPIIVDGIPYTIVNQKDGFYLQIGTGTNPVLDDKFTGAFIIPRSVSIPANRLPNQIGGGDEILNAPRTHATSVRPGKMQGRISTALTSSKASVTASTPAKVKGLQMKRALNPSIKNNNETTLGDGEMVTLTVYAVGANAFQGCTGLTEVTLPNNIGEIGQNAFAGCSSLTKFTCNAIYPPSIYSDKESTPFDGISSSCVLYVPMDCSSTYENNGWGNYFSTIEEVTEIANPEVGDIIKVALSESVSLRYIITSTEEGNRQVSVGTGMYDKHAIDEGFEGPLALPSTFTYSGQQYTVTGVAPYAFYYNEALTAIDIPESVLFIGDYAFLGCSALSEVTGAENLSSISYAAFQGCSALSTFFIPKSVTTIADNVFNACTNLRTIIMEERPKRNLSQLTQQTLDGWTSNIQGQQGETDSKTWTIDVSAGDILSFDYAVSSESGYDWLTVTVNGTVVVSASGEQSSSFAQDITSSGQLTVVATYSKDGSDDNGYDQASINNIGINLVEGGALYLGSCDGNPLFIACPLDSVYVGRDLSFQVGSDKGSAPSPFCYNSSLRAIHFSDAETEISASEFQGCENLQHVILGEGITSIGSYAFDGCYNLKTLECQAPTPPTLQNGVFPSDISNYCTLIVSDQDAYASSAWGIYFPAPIIIDGIPYKILSAQGDYYVVQIGMGTEPVLPANFSGEFTIPRTVEIPVSKIPTMDEGGGEDEPAEPILNIPRLQGKTATSQIEKTKGLPLDYFLQRNVRAKTEGEETITFTVRVIGANAFQGCTGLTKVTMPRLVSEIGANAFAGCSGLTEFYSYAEQPPYLNMVYAEGDKNPTTPFEEIGSTCVLYVPEDYGQTYQDQGWNQYFAEIREMEGIEIEDPQPGDVIKVLADEGVKVRYIITNNEEGNRTVCVGTGNSSRLAVDADYDGPLTIPNSFTYSGETYTVTEVSPYAFYNCGISAIELPESIISIGESAFYGCTSLSEVTGAEGLISINPYAFNGCSAMTSIFIPKTTSIISDYAFSGCTSLSQVIMEDGIVKELSEENQKTFENWTSTNHNNSSSSSHTWTIEANPGDVLSFDYTVSSESGYDILNVTVNGTNVVSVSGEVSDTYVQTIGSAGSITVYARYSKDSSASYGSDEASVFNIGLNLVAGGGLSLGSNGSSPLFASCPLDSVYVGRDISYSTNSNKGYSPFYNNQSLRSIVFSNQETQISTREFYYCTNLQNIVLGEGITSIGTYSFYNCSNLHSIQCLSNTPAALQSNAFPSDIANYCTLTVENENAYVFSDWATYFPFSFYIDGIPYRVFGRDENNNITVQMGTGSGAVLAESTEGEFEIPQTIEYVTSDSTLTFPVVAIADSAFYNLSNLTKVTIPATIKAIGAKAFANCTGLTEFRTNAKVPPTINNYSNIQTFQGITSECILVVPDSCGSAYLNSNWAPYFSDIVEDRGENAGARVGDIATIEDENGNKIRYIITSVEEGNCTASVGTGSQNKPAVNADVTEALVIPETITFYDQAFTVNAVTNYAFYQTKISEIDLSEQITSIGNYAFYGCTELTNVTGGENITNIGQYAFYNTKLTKAFIPDNVETIGNYAFQNIPTLKEIAFGPKVQSINRSIFNNGNYTSVEKFVFNGTYTEIPSDFLRYNSATKEVILGDQITSIGSYAFYGNRFSEINLPEGLTSIGQYAFYNCDSLRTITIPDYVTNFSTYAFRGCDNLQSVHIGTGVTTIGSYSFEGCSALNQLTGCENVTSIEQYAFSNCNSLTSLNFEKVTTIGQYAFYYCSGLTSFDCENITSIEQYAFAYCSKLTSFDCHDKITILSAYAFAYCSMLKELKGLKAVKNVNSYAIYQDYNLTELEMGENLTQWNSQSGYSSSYILKLLSITLPGQTIPFNSSNSYYGLPDGMILLVPAELVESYKSNSYTSRFRILPIGSTDERLIATENGGELQEKILAAELDPATVLSLAISGPINGTDIDYIHCYLVNLRTLDLEDAQIVNGGDSYHQWTISSSGSAEQYGSNSYNTENNVVGTYMFAYMTSLQRLILPKDVTKINSYAFSDCPQLTEVIIPDAVESIGSYAFSYNRSSSYNNKITSLTLPSKLKQINTYTFRNMDYLQSIVIPDSVTSIGQYAFYDCDALRTVVMGNKVTSIGAYAFNSCDKLYSINLSEALDTLGTYVFTSCANLTEPITIPATLRTIPDQAFYGCQKLKGVIFNEGLITIKASAFNDCDALTEIVLPESLNEIQSYSFAYCNSLTKITLPTAMKAIGQYAFYSCYKLTDITMPETLNSMNTYVFANCTSLPSITLPETITNIPNYTFNGCTALTDVELSSQTSSIGQYTFSGCTSLTYFDFDKYPQLTQLSNYSFSNTGFTEIEIPDRIVSLLNGAFSGCKSLQRAKMPTGVNNVASYLFQNCTALIEVEMHDGINVINSYAFNGCTKLPTIDLNDGITSIGSYAFQNCDSLNLEKLPDNLETINNYAFYSCDKLNLATLPAGVKTIGESAFSYCPNLKLESLPTGLTALNYMAFAYSGIKKMALPEGITTWGNGIFYECDSLRQVTWPADKTVIPNSTFYGCQNLQNPELPNTVTTINQYAFCNCNFTEFTFPTSLQAIGDYAFQYTYGLSEIELPISLKSIGYEAFYGSRLHSIEIPDSVTTLGRYTFYNCDSLRTATLGKNMNYSGNSYFDYFQNCDNLETLRIYAGTPPPISSSYVSSYYKKCVLEVPEGADSLYLATNIWKDFKEIRTFSPGDKLDSLDFAIMKVIYRQLDGDNWTKKWDLSSDDLYVGKWTGVTTKDGHITKISLASNNLYGELPDSIFMLPELTELYIGNNYIGGDIGTLFEEGFRNEKLTIIYLQSNELEGDLYPFASKFPNLEKLSIGYNRLTAISQPISKEKMTSVGTNIWFNFQFVDGKTYQPVVTEDHPATQVRLGQPFQIEWNTLQLYNHNNQDYSRSTNTLGWTYVNSNNDGMNSYSYDNYFQKNSEGEYVPSNILFKFPKNTPIPLYIRWSYYNDYYVPTTIVSLDWIDGDINADLSVDVTDLQKVIYYALNDNAPSNSMYNFTSADGNSDNAIDVRDAVICVNHILDFDEVQTPAGVRALYNREYNIARNNVAIENGIIRLANRDEVAAMQFTVVDAQAEDITLSPTLAGFRMSKKQVGQNVRIVIYNMAGALLPEGEHDLVKGLNENSAISHAVLSDEETNHLEVGIRELVTDIDGIRTYEHTDIYDLNGRKVARPQKGGVYIVNGKKTIIK